MTVVLTCHSWRNPKNDRRYFEGARISPGAEAEARLLALGMARKARGKSSAGQDTQPGDESVGKDQDAPPYLDGSDDEVGTTADSDSESEDSDTDDADAGDLPRQTAPKAEWVAYAIANGMPEKQANALDRKELIERFR